MGHSESFADTPATWRSTTAGVGAVAAVICATAVAVVLGLRVANEGIEPVGQNWWLVAWLVVGATNIGVGAALIARRGYRRLAGCMVALGLAALIVAVSTQADGYADAIGRDTGWARASGVLDWSLPIAGGLLAAALPWALVTRRRSAWSEAAWWLSVAMVTVAAVAGAASSRGSHSWLIGLVSWLLAGSATAATLALISVWWRQRTTADDPLPGWLAVGAAATWLAVVPGFVDNGWHLANGDTPGPLFLLATVPLLLVGAVVVALRDHPGRFHGIAHDVIGWLVFCGAIVVLYTAAVAGLGGLVGGSGPTWLLVGATGLIAIAAEPVRVRTRGAVDRLVWGARDDPLEVVRSVIDHVGPDSGEELLPALVATLRLELRVDAVAIDVRAAGGWRRGAAAGPPTTFTRSVDLEQRGEVVGRLVVGWEHSPSLRARDERLLAQLAGALGLAVGWVRLAGDLQHSRLAVVSAREEERRRLRRDLHDGLGPALTGVALGLRTAVRQLDRAGLGAEVGPPRALVARGAEEVDSLVAEVKRIVRDLRPTALDHLGLVGAVTEFARNLEDDVHVELALPAATVELPAAVEVAAYRIVTEALTNVVRHAGARRCWLTISIGSTIEIEVTDDGVGCRPSTAPGVGWTAMRERATELGGTLLICPRLPQGTDVCVRLPAVLP
jgi:two-component system, NarL family, sensor kinase